jgi:hypothetical protein
MPDAASVPPCSNTRRLDRSGKEEKAAVAAAAAVIAMAKIGLAMLGCEEDDRIHRRLARQKCLEAFDCEGIHCQDPAVVPLLLSLRILVVVVVAAAAEEEEEEEEEGAGISKSERWMRVQDHCDDERLGCRLDATRT